MDKASVILNDLLRDQLSKHTTCPACGKPIKDMPPEENMLNHWLGDCKTFELTNPEEKV